MKTPPRSRTTTNILFLVILLVGLMAWVLLGTRAGGQVTPTDVTVPQVSTGFLNVDLSKRTEGLQRFGDIPVKVPPEQYHRDNPFAGL